MRTILFLYIALSSLMCVSATTLRTPWADDVTANNVWQQYPRPSMTRSRWMNLNGNWDYAITPTGTARPTAFDGKILVPFPIESELSGVKKRVGADNDLWYRRTFEIPRSWHGNDVMLNFGAVDWRCDVWVNNIRVGAHQGGYSPFSLNITDALNTGTNTLTVKVWDPSDKGLQPSGKQMESPNGIWYTPVTGIWQTVWLEPVPENHINRLKITPDIDSRQLTVEVSASGNTGLAKIDVYDNNRIVASRASVAGIPVVIDMPEDMKLWDTTDPHIYDLKVTLSQDGKKTDEVGSYAAMRKVSMGKDGRYAPVRFRLNDKDIFHFGPLDQGWWPDGLYTAPSYQAMIFDIDRMHKLGFNMIRKHVKVEPELWYEYCDRNGILVWQDMPNIRCGGEWQDADYHRGQEYYPGEEVDSNYRQEWREIIDALYNHPSIVTWIPFNEGWGQFCTTDVVRWTKEYDPTRLVNAASGGNFYVDCGDILDVHIYPAPDVRLLSKNRANVIGEYGGIGFPMAGHLWSADHNWGYVKFDSADKVTDEYVRYIDILIPLAQKHYTGAVYTQTTDVEIEVNGLMTYDRKEMKVDTERVREANLRLIKCNTRR